MTHVTEAVWKGNKEREKCAGFLLLGLVMVIAGYNFGCKKSSPGSGDLPKDSHAPQIKGVLHLEPFVVNLADSEDNRFLRVGIDLGLGTVPPAKEGKAEAGDTPIPRIRDCILAVLSTWRSDALLAPEGKQKLKDELAHALQDRVPDLGVKEIYFTDFLVQR